MALLYILLGGFLLSSMHSPSCLATSPANGDTLAAGQTLAAGDKLVSRNGKFALGFFQFQPGPGTMSKSANTTTITSSSGILAYGSTRSQFSPLCGLLIGRSPSMIPTSS
jgi:hypothetical protein